MIASHRIGVLCLLHDRARLNEEAGLVQLSVPALVIEAIVLDRWVEEGVVGAARLASRANTVGGNTVPVIFLERVMSDLLAAANLTVFPTLVKVLEHFDLLIANEAENQGGDLHDHGEVCAE